MLLRRRPAKRTNSEYRKKFPLQLNYPQIRKEVALWSQAGIILRDSNFFRTKGDRLN